MIEFARGVRPRLSLHAVVGHHVNNNKNMKYRKKPIVIEAFKWTGGPDQTDDPVWAVEAIKAGSIRFENSGTPNVVMLIDTLEGTMRGNQGDYIIQGVKGEIYPCKPDIFEATYEAVCE